MADFSILTEVVPAMSKWELEDLKKVWRDWMNDQPEPIRQWLTRPLRIHERRILQCQFAVDWYRKQSLNAQDDLARALAAEQQQAQDAVQAGEKPYARLPLDFGGDVGMKTQGVDANGSPVET